jgi:hypothetical protein
VERRVIETSLRMGIPPRVEISDPEEARPYLEMGVRHFSLATDLAILYNGWKRGGAAMRELLGE